MPRGTGMRPANGAAEGTGCIRTMVSLTLVVLQKHVSLLALVRSCGPLGTIFHMS